MNRGADMSFNAELQLDENRQMKLDESGHYSSLIR